ncbi:efflux RND transporter periplasmic adaptor subunit [Arachidicoccus terrestris]|uniref:efflux RND transporter periplasmic adaptor subunit n=1 Tax=Arachidicoccus terrestris TaxID=2875539 RepID=UPI001CC4AF38|nr:efflux RND transporter periplasmic adaptor subunit [Arachidicoccus terrestris]UAY55300.1 efflux RND transporter periplasmic adaptor subunit [Arachidicoccus terrestris]
MKYVLLPALAVIICMTGCHGGSASTDSGQGDMDQARQQTPVTITSGNYGSMADSIALNAVSAYLLEIAVKNDMNGYIKQIASQVGDKVWRGEPLFTIQTKESKNIGNIINQLDSSFRFSGTSRVKSPASGLITLLNHQVGDYVQEGEVLATIADAASFGFKLNLPFEYRQKIRLNQSLKINLPDGTAINGTVKKVMPQMDSVSQTQQIFIKTAVSGIPSALMASVFLTTRSFSGFILPTASIYADENKQHYWVLQLLNDSTVHKVPVVIGLENDSQTGIDSPHFSPQDRFVLEGGYGLTDSSGIKITTPQ